MSEPKYLRIREPGKHALLNPDTGLHETPRPGDQYTADHPLVRAHPWAFGSEEDIAAEQEAARNVREVPVPPAPAAEGEKRAGRRR